MNKVLDKVVIAALIRLQDKDGRIDKHRVYYEARDNPNCPFRHLVIDKNRESAAEAYYIERAAELIRQVSFKITDSSKNITIVPVFARDPTKKGNEPGHINIDSASEDPEVAQAILEEALQDIEELAIRHRLLVRLLNVQDEFNDLVKAAQVALRAVRKPRSKAKRKPTENRPTP